MIFRYYASAVSVLNKGRSAALLLARLAVAYGFYTPAMMKWSDMNATAAWFAFIGIPMPTLNAYLAATTELTGVILLTLGLMTRIIALPLMVVMAVAVATVHWPHGFEAGNNGFEIPLYYLLFLAVFLTHGAGKASLDYLLFGEEA